MDLAELLEWLRKRELMAQQMRQKQLFPGINGSMPTNVTPRGPWGPSDGGVRG